MIRPATEKDLPALAAIQSASPEAASWPPDVLHTLVWQEAGTALGFITWLEVTPTEAEILNLAVAPGNRRRGIGRALIFALAARGFRTVYLEVRESNQAARNFYERIGFQELGRRKEYYQNPPEAAVVMRLSSC